MLIGIRDLDGHPESFYRLSREQQVNTLAALLAERVTKDPKAQKEWTRGLQIHGTPEALAFWSKQGVG